ncbi:Anti-sigma-K factor RskA [Lentzea fradiae]|uniref:Regulator of SigK n=1 Tax=Lentzea fradiae TaxID=200378 RepID=A0A1G7V6U8_9PSEU|nr:anti-sigma factor [Lentzea fradiae]SDG55605.1 Anti-sigma-K factor RskA [Lentzea fradiae]
MRSTSADLHTLTGAYALNALSGPERTAFETHLARCESCATEVAELTATAARLGAAVEFAPPAHLKDRVLAAAAETRQLSPHTPRLPRPRGLGRAGGALLAAACLVAVAFVAVEVSGSGRDDQLAQLSSQYGRFSDLLTTPDARIFTGTGTNGATGTAVMSPSRNEMLFLGKDLPSPSGDRVYQLWMVNGEGPHSAGVLSSPTAPIVANGIPGAERVALTLEPRGGSPVPTGDPVVEIKLA